MKIKILLMIFLFLSFNIALADTVGGTATISNVAPNVTSVYTNSPRDLSGGNVTVLCNATISDINSYADISKVNATLWNPTYANETSSNNIYYHYTNSTCSLGTNISVTALPANCSFNVYQNAYVGTWTCKLIATDSNNATANNSTNITIYKCGDGSCTSGESCSVCSTDCGACSLGRSTGGIAVTTSKENKTTETSEKESLISTQPSSTEKAKESTPEITGKVINTPIIPFDFSLIGMIALGILVLIIAWRRHKKY